jgi:hypothetical protein
MRSSLNSWFTRSTFESGSMWRLPLAQSVDPCSVAGENLVLSLLVEVLRQTGDVLFGWKPVPLGFPPWVRWNDRGVPASVATFQSGS